MNFENLFTTQIPKFYSNLIDWSDEHDPLRLMVVPDPKELDVKAYEMTDPIGDKSHEPVPGLIHRYPDRALLLLTSHCGVHCRFCFRKDVVGKVRPIDIKAIEAYLCSHGEIHEVIFSGGDPGTFPPAFFKVILEMLGKIKHIKTIRVHTRIFVVDPTQFQDEWLNVFASNQKQRVVVLHINHPREITAELRELVAKLKDKNVTVLSQSVLLKNVNDKEETLIKLFDGLANIGVLPYYLHHLDKARGTHHFRVSIAQGKKLFSSLRGKISGYKLPEYVLDLPGGDGKVPVMWLKKITDSTYEVQNFEGKMISYTDPAEI